MSEEIVTPENTQEIEQVTQETEVSTQEVETQEQAEVESQEVVEQVEDPRVDLIKGLQKGYTQTRQEFSDFKREIGEIKEMLKSNSSKEQVDEFIANDEILTRADLAKFYQAQEQAKTKAEAERLAQEKSQEMEKQRINEMLDTQIQELKIDGIIKTKSDEDSLMKFAVDYQLPDLTKAARLWQKLESERSEAKKEVIKKQVKAEEASKVGTSQKQVSQSEGIDYKSIHNTDWHEFN